MHPRLAFPLLALLAAGCAPVWPYGVEPAPVAAKPILPIIKEQLPLDQVSSACHGLLKDKTGGPVAGCALVGSYACVVIWPQLEPSHGYDQGHIDAIFAHELGHCSGLVHAANGQGWFAAPSTVAKAGG